MNKKSRTEVSSKERLYILEQTHRLLKILDDVSNSLEEKECANPILKNNVNKLKDSLGGSLKLAKIKFLELNDIHLDLEKMNRVQFSLENYPDRYRIPQDNKIFNK